MIILTIINDCALVENRSVEDIRMASKVLLGKLHSKVPIPYRDEVAISMKGKKLRFGYYISGTYIPLHRVMPHACDAGIDGFVKASPACQRAVMQTVEGVRAIATNVAIV